jgi:hypothetical protein
MTRIPIPWLRVIIEGVVIVGSILLAFGIDAAWDEKQERERVDRQFEALIREFTLTREELTRGLDDVTDAHEATVAVLELMEQADRTTTPAEVAERVYRSMDVGIFTTQHPVMTMMMASGDLVEFEERGLLGLLAQWRAGMEDLRIDAQHLEQNREQMIFNRLVTIGVALDFDRPNRDLLAMMDDPGLKAAFALRALRARMLAGSFSAALTQVDHILEVLEGIVTG